MEAGKTDGERVSAPINILRIEVETHLERQIVTLVLGTAVCLIVSATCVAKTLAVTEKVETAQKGLENMRTTIKPIIQ
ncbi:hypothetical protein TWF481_009201 [Arthrobotrys musiformis]|uniref:Uncharacterized protein n=1 Tax=Arthrobotrys musiformis TaxID=47236 RepID=A0AAV9W325_9PEZI